jgi:prevent-host-death family protein
LKTLLSGIKSRSKGKAKPVNPQHKTGTGSRKSVVRIEDAVMGWRGSTLTNLTNSSDRSIINCIETSEEAEMAGTQVNLYEAKTQLSSLVERAAKGEEIVIAKAGKPMVKLVALAPEIKPLRKFGQNLLGITYIADDFDAPLPEDVLKDFGL